MTAERPSWREHLHALAARRPGLHPYTLSLLLEVDGYRGIGARQVAEALNPAAAGSPLSNHTSSCP
jgi:hypothetical protein